MSILIQGMEMPENCAVCPIRSWNGEDDICPFSKVEALPIGRQVKCPLIEIPPHGRLIDADEAEEILTNDPTCITVFDAIKKLKQMPVIIPTEDDET